MKKLIIPILFFIFSNVQSGFTMEWFGNVVKAVVTSQLPIAQINTAASIATSAEEPRIINQLRYQQLDDALITYDNHKSKIISRIELAEMQKKSLEDGGIIGFLASQAFAFDESEVVSEILGNGTPMSQSTLVSHQYASGGLYLDLLRKSEDFAKKSSVYIIPMMEYYYKETGNHHPRWQEFCEYK